MTIEEIADKLNELTAYPKTYFVHNNKEVYGIELENHNVYNLIFHYSNDTTDDFTINSQTLGITKEDQSYCELEKNAFNFKVCSDRYIRNPYGENIDVYFMSIILYYKDIEITNFQIFYEWYYHHYEIEKLLNL